MTTDHNDEMTHIRRAARRRRYVIVAKDSIEDHRLSFKARGLLTYLLTKPDHWRVRADQLARESGQDGRTAVLSAMKELRDHGYLVTHRWQDPTTRQWRSETFVFESPDDRDDPQLALDLEAGVRFSDSGSPDPGSPDPGKPDPVVNNREVSTDSEQPQPHDDDAEHAAVDLDPQTFPTYTLVPAEVDYAALLVEWWELRGEPVTAFGSVAEQYRAAVRIAAHAGPYDPTRERTRWVGLALRIVVDYLGATTGEPVTVTARRHLQRLIASLGAERTIDAIDEAVCRGAGTDDAYAQDPVRFLLRYAGTVAHGQGR